MRQITVVLHHDEDVWWAESDDLPGFSAAADTLSDLRDAVRDGVAFGLDDVPHFIIETTGGEAWDASASAHSFGGNVARSSAFHVGYEASKAPAVRVRTNPRLVLT